MTSRRRSSRPAAGPRASTRSRTQGAPLSGARLSAFVRGPAVGATGWVYLAGALVLSVWFLLPTYAFYRSRTTRDARRVLVGSILYIPLLVVLIFVDRWV